MGLAVLWLPLIPAHAEKEIQALRTARNRVVESVHDMGELGIFRLDIETYFFLALPHERIRKVLALLHMTGRERVVAILVTRPRAAREENLPLFREDKIYGGGNGVTFFHVQTIGARPFLSKYSFVSEKC